MTRRALDTTSRGRNESLNGRSIQSTRELFFFGLDTRDDGDCEELFVNPAVEIEDVSDFLIGFGAGEVRGVALLPEELACAEERLGVLELPTDDGVPLVEFEGKVAVRLDPFCVVCRVVSQS